MGVVAVMSVSDAQRQGGSKGGGTHPLGQHDEASAESSAGRLAKPDPSSINTVVAPRSEVVHGGDRRMAGREPRHRRVTVRLTDREAVQLARVAARYRLPESGAIRAAIDMLDGAPAPAVVDRDVLRLVAAVNAVGVNVNQLTRQGWAGVEPALDDLHRVTTALLDVVKELGS